MWVFEGLLGLIRPESVRMILKEYFKENSPRSISIILFILGGFLILASPGSQAASLIRIIGWLIVAEGVLTLFLPVNWIAGVIKWWLNSSAVLYLLWAAFVLFLWSLLVFFRK